MKPTHIPNLTIALGAILLVTEGAASAQPIAPERLKEAATRAVAAIQRSQATWFNYRGCPSCHHQFQPAIAFASARAHGIPVDETIAASNAARSFNYGDIDEAIQYRGNGAAGVIEPASGERYRLVAAHAAGVRSNLSTAIGARHLMGRQHPDGHWAGMNQRPPSSSSDFMKTAIGLRAVQLFHHRADAGSAEPVVARAAAWLNSHTAPDTEGRTYQLLGLLWAGSTPQRRAALARGLGATQQADGGWGSIDGRASEAYSTAEALIALHEAGGVSTSDPAWQRGLAFLLRTQAADGTWHVPSRLHVPGLSPPYFESGYPYGHDQFISPAGAAWAVMAIAAALPPAARPAVPLPFARESAPIEPWVETVVFGTLAELRELLDNGLDPNTATKAGKTSVLMMASADAEKVRLLLNRGANVNARAESGFTALHVAATYRHSEPAMTLLFDRGATVEPPPGRVSIAYPLVLAAHAGNASVLERLHKSGDPVGTRVAVPGNAASASPMGKAIRNGDLDVVRTLLRLGANVDSLDGEPWTPLDLAVNNNRLDVARLLLETGADVNGVNEMGYTPLLLAASIDFGDTAMIDMLLRSAARIDMTNPAGKTALDLARDYQHHRFIQPLERAARADGEVR